MFLMIKIIQIMCQTVFRLVMNCQCIICIERPVKEQSTPVASPQHYGTCMGFAQAFYISSAFSADTLQLSPCFPLVSFSCVFLQGYFRDTLWILQGQRQHRGVKFCVFRNKSEQTGIGQQLFSKKNLLPLARFKKRQYFCTAFPPNGKQSTMVPQLSWQSKGLKILVSLVRFPLAPQQTRVTKSVTLVFVCRLYLVTHFSVLPFLGFSIRNPSAV